MDDNVIAALQNAGNTCYLNALLHVLARVAELRWWFQQHLICNRVAHAGLDCPLCLLARDLSRLCIDVDATPFVPEIVQARGRWSGGAFANRQQQDVQRFQ